MSDEQVAESPVLVLGNKIDRPGALSEEDLKQFFGLVGMTTGKVSFCSFDTILKEGMKEYENLN